MKSFLLSTGMMSFAASSVNLLLSLSDFSGSAGGDAGQTTFVDFFRQDVNKDRIDDNNSKDQATDSMEPCE